MVLSISSGEQYANHEHLIKNANLFRISNDFWDDWNQLKEQFDFMCFVE